MSNRRAQDERIEGTPDGVNAISEIVDVPDAPTIGTATAGLLSASVAFTPATTGGTVSLFTATSTPGSVTGTSATSPITVNGLTGGTEYTFTVSGENSTGTSPLSSASNSVSPLEFPGSYDALATVNISSNTSLITFQDIPTGYQHLQIRGINRDSNTNSQINSLYITFNDVGGTSYSWHRIQGFGTSVSAGGATSQSNIWIGPSATNGYISGVFSSHIIDILDYANVNKFKTVRHIGGLDNNGTGDEPGEINLTSGLFMSTNAITSITISKSGQSQLANTTFALYGIK